MSRHRSVLVLVAVVSSALGLAGTPPSPISVAPDQSWMGIDGSWNTITVRGGSPEQFENVFVSTASQQTWLVHKDACMTTERREVVRGASNGNANNATSKTQDAVCFDGRGRTFDKNASTTWRDNGFFQLWTEKNLGLSGNGFYGWDTIGLGLIGEETATLKNTTVGLHVSPNFWLGHFGINPKPTNFTAFTDPSPSYMSLLYEQKQIPSLSFGYTAGAKYHDHVVLSSLTLGGYDSSRFIANDLTFAFAPDNERDIVVGVVGINASTATKPQINLLTQDPFTMYIDSTIAELWLPTAVCAAFEKAFELQYDEKTQLYLVNDEQHQRLKTDNPSITFSLGQKFSTNTTVDITLPYSALDLTASAPYRGLKNATRYFPIRRGAKEDQFVLGRTFLQEAYLHVDWERQNFSVHAVDWSYNKPRKIVPYYSPKDSLNSLSWISTMPKHISTGSILGIALGVGLGSALLVSGVLWWFWRIRRERKMVAVKEAYAAAAAADRKDSSKKSGTYSRDSKEKTNVFPKAELHADDQHHGPVEAENSERQVFEMPGDFPTSEAGGRQLSEKETMMVREARINGVDPNSPSDVVPGRRVAPVLPSDVAMVTHTKETPVSPVTPHGSDGRSLETAPISPMDGSEPIEGSDGWRRRFSYEM